MNTFAKYLPMGLVALMVTLFSWLGGGTFPEWLNWWTPWLTLLIMEVLIVLPEVKKTETLMDARRRVWRGLLRDPFTWFGLALTVFLVTQWLNSPRELFFDAETRKWLYTPPPVPWLPFSINTGEGRSVLDWFPPVIAAVLMVRHGLLKPTKRLLCQFICWNAALLSLMGILQILTGSQFIFGIWGHYVDTQIFASFGYPNHAAAYFPAIMALSMGVWFWKMEHRALLKQNPHIYLIPTLLCAAGGVLSLSRAGVVFTLLVGFAGGLYAVLRYWGGWKNTMRIGFSVSAVALLALAAVCLMLPEKLSLRDELRDTEWKVFFQNPMLARSGYQGVAAWEMYKDYPAFGLGAWGYRRMAYAYVAPEDYHKMRGPGQANVHNDTLQYLAEHGTVGFGLMLACVFSLVIPFWIQLFKSPSQAITEEQKARAWPFRVNVIYVYILGATLMMAVHSFGELVFRSPACMIVWALMFVMAPGFLLLPPPAKRRTVPSPQKEESHA